MELLQTRRVLQNVKPLQTQSGFDILGLESLALASKDAGHFCDIFHVALDQLHNHSVDFLSGHGDPLRVTHFANAGGEAVFLLGFHETVVP